MHQWQPTASLENLKFRSNMLQKIREFFAARHVLEVETPLLCHSTATDPYLMSFTSELKDVSSIEPHLYLQTSPEFPMKRLLAAGYGSIYQICKAFRNGEVSKKHNPEFTILEWYRVEFDHMQLMDEMDDFLQHILATPKATRMTYEDLFQQFFAINPHTCSAQELKMITQKNNIIFENETHDRDMYLDLLMTHIVEPQLGKDAPLFLYNYPASQAALAVLRDHNNYQIGERFEVYYQGIELANGYHELGDSEEQTRRFLADNKTRRDKNLAQIPVDQHLLSALPHMPTCAGVALGVDRLIALAVGTEHLKDVIAFPIDRA